MCLCIHLREGEEEEREEETPVPLCMKLRFSHRDLPLHKKIKYFSNNAVYVSFLCFLLLFHFRFAVPIVCSYEIGVCGGRLWVERRKVGGKEIDKSEIILHKGSINIPLAVSHSDRQQYRD